MKRVTLAELGRDPQAFADKIVTVCGWVRSVRDSKAFAFLDLNDGSCFDSVQIVLDSQKTEHYGELVRQNVGAAVCITGMVVCTPHAKQTFELHAQTGFVEGASAPDYPLQKKRHSPEFLRTIAHLRPRTNLYSAAFRVRSAAALAVHRFFDQRGFLYTHTPIITTSDCEGAGELFSVASGDGEIAFFGKPAVLTVSGQLEGECFAQAFGKIYTFGPTFRAENSNTQRHAAEFWMIEPEMAFADLEDVMEVAQSLVQTVITNVMRECPQDLAFLNRFVDTKLIERLQHVERQNFVRMTYTEAVKRLQSCGANFAYPVAWGMDLQTEHERYLTEELCKAPVFVTDYPEEIKAFYMRRNDDGKTVAAVDLLVPGIGELIGGSQREERLDVLTARMTQVGLPLDNYWWYTDLRRFGGTRHAGFGLGFERLVMYLTGISNIRDVLPFPRTPGHAEF